MAKRLKNTDLPLAEIKRAADVSLADIGLCCAQIKALEDDAEEKIQGIQAQYKELLAPLQERLKRDVARLKDTMKSNKAALFDGTDVVNLTNGSLIHGVADKVAIPRDALAKCEELGFGDVIKIVKSLDREAVEKWPDERLVLIGAERKTKEEFSYDLKTAHNGGMMPHRVPIAGGES